MTRITQDLLQQRHDFIQSERLVEQAVDAALSDGATLLRFLGRYVSWNGHFGNGVAHLAAKVGGARAHFMDPAEAIEACADRSVHVASFFFDAARDEFDDGATPYRDTHRSLAQAAIRGVAEYYDLVGRANDILRRPDWLVAVEEAVYRGYGRGSSSSSDSLFEAMGFHLGSEILADEEFTHIDKSLRDARPELVQHLLDARVEIADAKIPPYYWIGIHSGLGGGVEMDHFEWAVRGVDEAFRFSDPARHGANVEAVLRGFDAFVVNHTTFFENVAR